jgi:D-alanine-D-alanine ligase
VRVAVLAGGRSSEHEISLASAASVRAALSEMGHDVVAIEIDREGRWRADGSELSVAPGHGLLDAEVAFPVLHGPYGEDGTIQGLLECLDVPYVGAGVLACAVCMEKVVFKELMARAGIPQVRYAAVSHERWRADRRAVAEEVAALGLPVFVKPAALGSSVGIVRVASPEALGPALDGALAHDEQAIVEAAAGGLEVECSVIGNREPIASEPGEIVVTSREWYDYEAKYTPGGMELVVPARVPEPTRQRVRELALETFSRSGCSGLARVDFFVDGDEVLVNELNTMPGFTETSVFGKLFAASGLPYGELLERVIGYALERHEADRSYRR